MCPYTQGPVPALHPAVPAELPTSTGPPRSSAPQAPLAPSQARATLLLVALLFHPLFRSFGKVCPGADTRGGLGRLAPRGSSQLPRLGSRRTSFPGTQLAPGRHCREKRCTEGLLPQKACCTHGRMAHGAPHAQANSDDSACAAPALAVHQTDVFANLARLS